MKKPFRLLTRLCFLIFVLAALGIGVVLAWFTSWRADKLATLEGGSEIVETNYGKIEFAVRGEGPAVLVLHGAPGGYDQALLFGSVLAQNGFKIIAPSRPGYLRTPLGTGITPLQEAEAMGALLDTLGVESVGILAVDAGAPAAIEFATHYPNRVWALALVSPLAKRYEWYRKDGPVEPGKRVSDGLTGDIGSWYCERMAHRDPARAIDWMLDVASTGDLTQRAITSRWILGHPDQLAWFQNFLGTFAPDSSRYVGTRNDRDRIRALQPDMPFKKITAPTLIVRGDLDAAVFLKDAKDMNYDISKGSLYQVPDTDHVVWLGPHGAEVEKKIEDFLKQYSGGTSQP